MADITPQETPMELIAWQKRTFFIKIAFYVLVLALLSMVAYRGFDDPCERCKVSVASLGGKQMTCREAVQLTYRVPDELLQQNGNFQIKSDYDALEKAFIDSGN